MAEPQAQKLAEELQATFVEKELVKIESKSAYRAERLEAAVVLNDVELMKDDDLDEDYTKAYFGGQQQFYFPQKALDFGGEGKKKNSRQARKEREAYEQFLLEKARERLLLSKPVVNRGASGSKCKDIKLENFTLTIGGRDLLDGADVLLSYGKRYGLIGRNGIGKTCLLNAIAAREDDRIAEHIHILKVEQEVIKTDITVLDSILEVDVERLELLAEEEAIANDESNTNSDRLTKIA